jgi:molecular chaperone DnaJ
MRDFYEVLGVDRDANENDIKNAYRNLAKKWHPDRFSTKSEEERKEAEEKFKEISEAYDTLSNPEKRQAYDMGGFDPFDGFDPFAGFNPFDNMGGFNPFGRSRQMKQKGETAYVDVNVTLKDIFNGENKTIEYDVLTECPHCKGMKSMNPDNVKTCPHCQGTGMMRTQTRKGNMVEIQQSPCPHCHMTGVIITDPCPHCKGEGLLLEREQGAGLCT